MNPRGDFTDDTEQGLAAGIAFAGRMHMLLKSIKIDGLTDSRRKELEIILHRIETIDPGKYQEREEGTEEAT